MGTTHTSAFLRKDVLNKYYDRWSGLYSTASCLICLCRPPEHMLPCQHSLCDNCVVTYGLASQVAEYYFDLTRCPICNQAFKITIRQLPPTKRPVVLSLDGGGIRGIIQLGLLHSLENRLGGNIKLSEIFELFVGTSVGRMSGPLPKLNIFNSYLCISEL